MSLLAKKQTQNFVVVGLNRYIGATGARCYMAALDAYEAPTRDQAGCFALSVGIPYEEADKVIAAAPGLLNPLVVECEGQTVSVGRNQTFRVERVANVVPYRSSSAVTGSKEPKG